MDLFSAKSSKNNNPAVSGLQGCCRAVAHSAQYMIFYMTGLSIADILSLFKFFLKIVQNLSVFVKILYYFVTACHRIIGSL